MMTESEAIWTAAEVSSYLKVSVNTLYYWRLRGYGPKGKRVGRYLRYKPSEVIDWFNSLSNEDN
jgi:predicted DNA-binding transcriptional regulator AlpA